MNIISKISAGKASLFTAFCLICFPLGIVINLADNAGGRGDQVFLVLLIPFLWSLYGVWKCAFNVRYRTLGYISRGVIVANGLIFFAVFVATFANEIRQPQASKNTIPIYRTWMNGDADEFRRLVLHLADSNQNVRGKDGA